MQLRFFGRNASGFILGVYLIAVAGICLYSNDGEAKEIRQIKLSCRILDKDTIGDDYRYTGSVVEIIIDETTKKYAKRTTSTRGESDWQVKDAIEITDHKIRLYDYNRYGGDLSGGSSIDRITDMYDEGYVDVRGGKWRSEIVNGICEPKPSLRWPAQRF